MKGSNDIRTAGFDAGSAYSLGQTINDWLKKNRVTELDIQYRTVEGCINKYSALVTYREINTPEPPPPPPPPNPLKTSVPYR